MQHAYERKEIYKKLSLARFKCKEHLKVLYEDDTLTLECI